MNQQITLQNPPHMYKVDDFHESSITNTIDLNNRLLCTFTTKEDLNGLLDSITSKYDILYNKIFVLHIKSNDEYVCTYNIDQDNVSSIPSNTILVHRKKDSNTLYTINALNELIKTLNGGVVNTRFPIDWQHYRNTIMLTQNNELKQLRTKIYRIIEL